MIRRPPVSTRPYTLLPYPTLFRSPARPAPLTAWYEEATRARSPNSACSAPSATIMERVVQLGLAMIPRGRFRAAWELTRSEEHTSELQSLMRISYAVFCLKKKKKIKHNQHLCTRKYNTKPDE